MTYGELLQQTIYRLSSKSNKLFNFNNIKEKFPQLSHQEIRLLGNIIIANTRGEKISASQLGKMYGVTTAAIMHKLDVLETEGYIVRIQDENDKRIRYITVGDKLTNHVEEFKKNMENNINGVVNLLGDDDTRNLIRILNKLMTVECE